MMRRDANSRLRSFTHENLEVGDKRGQRSSGVGGDAAGVYVPQIGEPGVKTLDVLSHGLRFVTPLRLDHHGGDGFACIFGGHDLLGDLGRGGDHIRHGVLVDEHRIVEAGAGVGELGDDRPLMAVEFDGAVGGHVDVCAGNHLTVFKGAFELGCDPWFDDEVSVRVVTDDLQLFGTAGGGQR